MDENTQPMMKDDKPSASQTLLGILGNINDAERAEDKKEEVRSTLAEIQAAQDALATYLKKLHEAKDDLENIKIGYNAATGSMDNIVSGITNAIVKAEQARVKVGINDEGLAQLKTRNDEVVNGLYTALGDFENRQKTIFDNMRKEFETLFEHQKKELNKIRNIEEGAYFNGRTYWWMFGLAFLSYVIIIFEVAVWACLKFGK